MKRIALIVFCSLAVIPAFASKKIEVAPDFLEGTYFCASLLPQYQVPIPWTKDDTQNPTWGEKRVTGVVVDILYGENLSVTGFGFGLVTRALDYSKGVQLGIVPMTDEGYGCQFGVFNRAPLFRGFQLGLVNWSDDHLGVQLGLVNIISKSPVAVFPLLNLRF